MNGVTRKGNIKSAPGAGRAGGRGGQQDAIDQLFIQLDLAYPSLFARHYHDAERLGATKKLWYHHLRDIAPEVVMKAVNNYIAANKYLPSIHDILQQCLEVQAVPTAKRAWQQAINLAATEGMAPDDRKIHPVIHRAARLTGWERLREADEGAAELFRHHYQHLCRKALAGESLDMPAPAPLPPPKPLPRKDAATQLRKLRQLLGGLKPKRPRGA